MNDKLGFVEERVQSSEYRVQIYIVVYLGRQAL